MAIDIKALEQKALAIAIKHQKAMAKELAIEVAFAAIQQVVDDSPNKIDDIFWSQAKDAAQKAIEGL